MPEFDYAVTLFGLLLGLALTEALSGLARAIKSRNHVRIGWPTALLGTLLACDAVTFWAYGWLLREKVSATWPMLFAGFVVTSIYYVSASLIFPSDPEYDHDRHFAENYRLVLAGFLACNAAFLTWVISITGSANFLDPRQIIITWSLFPVAICAMWTRDRRVVLGCMCWLIALYPLSLVWD